MRAGLSVPEHGNVMVARGDWRRYRPGGLWLDLRHHHCLVRDPHDTLTLAVFTYLFIHLGKKEAHVFHMHEMQLI